MLTKNAGPELRTIHQVHSFYFVEEVPCLEKNKKYSSRILLYILVYENMKYNMAALVKRPEDNVIEDSRKHLCIL